MHVRVCSADGRTALRIRGIARSLPVRDLKPLLVDTFAIPAARQGLLFMGKQLLAELTLHDYGVQDNDMIHVFDTGAEPRPRLLHVEAGQSTEAAVRRKPAEEEEETRAALRRCSFSLSLYRSGDVVDVRDAATGAWLEARVVDVRRRRRSAEVRPPSSSSGSDEESEPVKRPRSSLDTSETSSRRSSLARRDEQLLELSWDDDFEYSVSVEKSEEDDDARLLDTTGRHLRPRAQRKIRPSRLTVGDQVLVNYNPEVPQARGLWFDAVVTSKKQGLKRHQVTATVFAGPLLSPVKDCRLLFPDEIFALEVPGMQVNAVRDGEMIVRRRDQVRPRGLESDLELGFGAVGDAAVGRVWTGRAELAASGVHRPRAALVDVEAGVGVLSLVLTPAPDVADRGREVEVVAARRLARLSLLEKNLRHGRPVRVVRSGGKFGPQIGTFRYDGLYAIDRCWSVADRSQSAVWHFLLRREDEAPEPWTTVVRKRLRRRSVKENERPAPVLRRKRRRESVANEAATPGAKRRAVVRKQ